MRAEFFALDKLTLLEIERLFSDRITFSTRRADLLPPVLSKKTGRTYLEMPGAVFFELEDLQGSIAK